MFDFIRTASVVPKVSVGNVDYNTDEIISYISKLKHCDIIVFPELCMCGYTCADLFFQQALHDSIKSNLKRILEVSKDLHSLIAIGAPFVIEGQLYDCALIICKGRVCGIEVKTFLPNYNEFYEKRWFSVSEDLTINSIEASVLGIDDSYEIPVGRNLIFSVNDKIKIGVEICEDLWSPLPPSTFLAVNGANVILNLSASNETISKRRYRESLIKQQSARSICGYVYSSAGADESTTDLIFSGHSMICENGTCLKQNEKLIDSDYYIVSDIDMGKIYNDRMENKSFKDTSTLYGKHEPCITVRVDTDFDSNAEYYNISQYPFVPQTESDRIERCMDIFNMQVSGLKKRVDKTGGKMVIGVSGGLDSTLALLVCAEVARQMDKPLTDVIAITLPCFGTTKRTHSNAWELMQTLGVRSLEIDIKNACTQHCKDIGHDIDKFDVTYENIQARERTQVLMDYACQEGGFVVGTGDLSELALGWCTYNADHMSMYGVNCGVPKTLVKWMIASIINYNIFPKSTDVLKDIIDTPISPELLPPDKNGNIQQETEEIIGPYVLHDFFLYYLLRFGYSPTKIFFLARKAFLNVFETDTIIKWLRHFYKRFFNQQFKRSCLPDGVKIGSVCLSPRGDWRMPSDASYGVWIKEIDELDALYTI